MGNYRRNYRKRQPVRNYRKRTSYKKKSLGIKRIVKKCLSKNLEVKTWVHSIGLSKLTDYGSLTFDANNKIELTPTTGQQMGWGVGSSQRIGNKIRVKKASLNLVMYAAGFDNIGNELNQSPQPYDVRMIITHSKQTPSEVIVGTNFFNNGNTSAAPQNRLIDMCRQVNRDVFVVSKDSRFKIGNSSYEGSAANPAFNFYSNNDYNLNLMRTFDVTKYLPKNIEFNDASAIPTSFVPAAIFLLAPANGTVTPPGEYPIEYFAELKIDYTDA